MQFNLDTVLAILVSISPVLFPAMAVLYHVILSQLPAAKRARVEHEVGVAVAAVEQIYQSVPGSGAYKKAEVQRLLGVLGVKSVDATRLNVLIEAAVAVLPSGGPPAPTAPHPAA